VNKPNVYIWPDVLRTLDKRRLESCDNLSREVVVNSILMGFLRYDENKLKDAMKSKKLNS
jgi:hypothetical protein